MQASLARALRCLSARGSGAVSVTGERPFEHMPCMFHEPGRRMEGGAGGTRWGPLPGVLRQRVPAMGRHEDITALVFEGRSKASAQTRRLLVVLPIRAS